MTKGVLAWLGLTMMAVAAAAQTGTVPLDAGTPPSGLTNSTITELNGNVGIGTTASSQNALQVVSSSGNAGQFVITVPSPTSTDAQNLTSMSGAILKLQNLSVRQRQEIKVSTNLMC